MNKNNIKIITIESYMTSNCYIIDINNNEFRYLVDPSINLKQVKEITNKLDGILITHSHIDHIMMLDEIYNYYKCKIYMNKNGLDLLFNSSNNCADMFGINKSFKLDDYKDDIIYVGDGDNINNLFKALYTPGHSIDSVCYIIEDVMFTGDTLFNKSVGRCDLYSGNSYELNKSLKRLINLKNDYKIYPGHDEASTLKIQALTNPFVRDILKY